MVEVKVERDSAFDGTVVDWEKAAPPKAATAAAHRPVRICMGALPERFGLPIDPA